jgi:hypothetical protein
MILLNGVIPISLYVTLEVVKIFQVREGSVTEGSFHSRRCLSVASCCICRAVEAGFNPLRPWKRAIAFGYCPQTSAKCENRGGASPSH